MLHLTPSQKEIVQTILATLAADCDVWVFGSRANGKPKPFSDLDLCLKAKNGEPLTLKQLAVLEEAFSESLLPFKVDVVDWYTLSEPFKLAIEPQLIEFAK
jgi:predicted nucleotidyltransferase